MGAITSRKRRGASVGYAACTRNKQGGLVIHADTHAQGPVCAPPRFETLQHASSVITDWIGFYNHQRPHQELNMRAPAEAYALAA